MGRHLAVRISRGPRIARPQLAQASLSRYWAAVCAVSKQVELVVRPRPALAEIVLVPVSFHAQDSLLEQREMAR